MRTLPGDGEPRTPIKPNFVKSPMKPLVALGEKASEYPQKYHWKVMTDMDIIHAQIRLRADFLRARPEYRKPRPGTMIKTMAEATMMYAWSPDWYHWLRLMTSASNVNVQSRRIGPGGEAAYSNRHRLAGCR